MTKVGVGNLNISFNPRTHMGCDYPRFRTLGTVGTVSIHAPTWGATVFAETLYI